MSRDREHRIAESEAGRRLDAVLATLWPDLSRSRIQKLMREGHIRVDDRAARASQPARAGARISIRLPEPEPSHLEAQPIPLDIVLEDDHLLVVNKPAGLVVHPGAGNRSGTLVNALIHHLPGLVSVGGVGRPGIVHRLDKGTSGLLLVAKTDTAHRRLSEAMAERQIHRRYLALIWGEPGSQSGRIEAPLGRHPHDRKKMAVVAGGRAAATRYRVVEPFGWSALIECDLESGRTHQIRVHLSHLGHPLLSDPTYGGGARRALNLSHGLRRLAGEAMRVLSRPALHATRLEFSHPVSGRGVTLVVPLPEDFAHALEVLRRGE